MVIRTDHNRIIVRHFRFTSSFLLIVVLCPLFSIVEEFINRFHLPTIIISTLLS
jgi:hypothetical protein